MLVFNKYSLLSITRKTSVTIEEWQTNFEDYLDAMYEEGEEDLQKNYFLLKLFGYLINTKAEIQISFKTLKPLSVSWANTALQSKGFEFVLNVLVQLYLSKFGDFDLKSLSDGGFFSWMVGQSIEMSALKALYYQEPNFTAKTKRFVRQNSGRSV